MSSTGIDGPVLVVAAVGYRNLGDEAMLAGLLRSLHGSRVTVVSRDPTATHRLHGVESIGIETALSALRRHCSVVIGGGGLFGRDMGMVGRLLPVFGEIAARSGRQVHLRGVGFDADMPVATRMLLRRLLRVTRSATVRDAASAAVVSGWGGPVKVEPDLSAGMAGRKTGHGRRLLASAGILPGRRIVGLALTAVDAALGDRVVEAAAGAIAAMPDAEFCFVPMSRHPAVAAHDDRQVADRIRRLAPRLRIAEPEHPADALALFGACDAVVGMRYHSLLFADRAGVPLVPIPYAEKCRHWLAEYRIPAVAPDSAALVTALEAALASRPEICAAS